MPEAVTFFLPVSIARYRFLSVDSLSFSSFTSFSSLLPPHRFAFLFSPSSSSFTLFNIRVVSANNNVSISHASKVESARHKVLSPMHLQHTSRKRFIRTPSRCVWRALWYLGRRSTRCMASRCWTCIVGALNNWQNHKSLYHETHGQQRRDMGTCCCASNHVWETTLQEQKNDATHSRQISKCKLRSI